MTAELERAYAGARSVLTAYIAAQPHHRPGLIAKLRPRAEDYARVFEPEHAVEAAARGYLVLWGNAPVWPLPPEAGVMVYAASAEMMASPTPTLETDHFPGGYHSIACWLKKGVIWTAWTWTSKGRAGGAVFDGLVEVEPERWAWFPRPWKVLPKPPGPQLWWDE
jgi:hypothetical protein